MMSIAERATAAYRLLQQHSMHPLILPRTAADIARTAGRLAALLGIDPAHVQPNRNWNHLSLPFVPLTLHASDPDDPEQVYTFSYRDPLYEDEPFLLLGPCPICHAAVPLAEIRSLADLGAFLTLPDNGTLPAGYPDEFDQDRAHTTTCPYREGDH
ncbi:hypothetical protein [Streptomyces sp. NBC_00079]|uniref:hypothetical protein n=1 Tax=Streptomyces sp. NBC_00079 TaxID=2975644 RepID=UPI00324C8EB7